MCFDAKALKNLQIIHKVYIAFSLSLSSSYKNHDRNHLSRMDSIFDLPYEPHGYILYFIFIIISILLHFTRHHRKCISVCLAKPSHSTTQAFPSLNSTKKKQFYTLRVSLSIR